MDRDPHTPEDPWQSPEVQTMLLRQRAELSEAGIVLAYLNSLYDWSDQLRASNSSGASIVRESAESTNTPIAGVNIIGDDDDEPNTDVYILLQIDINNGDKEYGSRITVGEIIGGKVNVVNPPFSEGQLRLLERHVQEQRTLGIEISLY